LVDRSSTCEDDELDDDELDDDELLLLLLLLLLEEDDDDEDDELLLLLLRKSLMKYVYSVQRREHQEWLQSVLHALGLQLHCASLYPHGP
jgi:hypothetical protein